MANRKAPSESLTNVQPMGKKSPLMNYMEMHQEPETASTGRFRKNSPSRAQRILLLPLRSLFSFLRSHNRAIGVIVVVAILALLFVFRPDGPANMQRDNSEIHFEDVTIHPLNSSSSDISGSSNQDDNSSSNRSGLHSSVSATEREMKNPPTQPYTSATQITSDDKHGAWLTGKIEFDEASQSRSLPGRNRIGQRIKYFSQNAIEQ
jgi:hypothetical protein